LALLKKQTESEGFMIIYDELKKDHDQVKEMTSDRGNVLPRLDLEGQIVRGDEGSANRAFAGRGEGLYDAVKPEKCASA
jgi:hypothetical protein